MESNTDKSTIILRVIFEIHFDAQSEISNGRLIVNNDRLINTSLAESLIEKEIPIQDGDLIIFGLEKKEDSKLNRFVLESLLGKLRVTLWSYGQEKKILKLFEYTSNGTLKSTHHPFTAPLGVQDVEAIKKIDVMKIHSTGCDLVLNGNEIGGGFE